jgi:hypothetical protein
MEYALGLDPNAPDTTGLPSFTFVTNAGAQYGALSYPRVKSATDLDYSAEVSDDLVSSTWTPLTNVVSTVDRGETETVTVRDSVSTDIASQRFFRFRVAPVP